jgi:gliding motility-associated-like protein
MLRFCGSLLLILLSQFLIAQVGPTNSIAASSTVFCTGTPVVFSPASVSAGESYTWNVVPGTGVTLLPNANSQTITLSFQHPLNHTVYLTVKLLEESTTYSRVVQVSRRPEASFNAHLTSVGYPNELVLSNYSTGTLKNYWFFENGEVDSSFNTSRSYGKGGSYSVTLLAVGQRGCSDTARHAFRISDSSSLVLPNVFSPNDDGVNDVYKLETNGISSMSAWVYSRTGVPLHRWDKVNGGWDGRNAAGEPCPQGQYFIVTDAWGFDGKSYKLKGTITLVR